MSLTYDQEQARLKKLEARDRQLRIDISARAFMAAFLTSHDNQDSSSYDLLANESYKAAWAMEKVRLKIPAG